MSEEGESHDGGAADRNNNSGSVTPPPPPNIRTHLPCINNMVINIFKEMPLSAKLIKNKAIETSNMDKLVNYVSPGPGYLRGSKIYHAFVLVVED
jgi:hypothetical protein